MITETDPLLPLQGAMFAALDADATLNTIGVKVFDFVDADYYPRIVIGEDRANPEDTDCHAVSDVFSTVRVYTNTAGKVQCKLISERVRFILTRRGGFTVEGFDMPVGHCERLQIETHQDDQINQGILEFNYRLVSITA